VESMPTLANGRKVFFESFTVKADEALDGKAPQRKAVRKSKEVPGVAIKDLAEKYRSVEMFTRLPGKSEWTSTKSRLPDELIMPVIDGEIEIGTVFEIAGFLIVNRIEILPDGSWIFCSNNIDTYLPGPNGKYPFTSDVYTKPICTILRSTDEGKHWEVWREIPHGGLYTAPGAEYKTFSYQLARGHLNIMPGGDWVTAFRTERRLRDGTDVGTDKAVLFLTRSSDQGQTWSEPEPIRPSSTNPDGLVLPNGVSVRKYGRPGAFLTFCADDAGKTWGNDVMLIPERPHPQDTCNNNNMIVTGPDRFYIVYSDFGYRNDKGELQRAIIGREFVATKK
jgi:hypothetical protein